VNNIILIHSCIVLRLSFGRRLLILNFVRPMLVLDCVRRFLKLNFDTLFISRADGFLGMTSVADWFRCTNRYSIFVLLQSRFFSFPLQRTYMFPSNIN
jgi:hypothetical protein